MRFRKGDRVSSYLHPAASGTVLAPTAGSGACVVTWDDGPAHNLFSVHPDDLEYSDVPAPTTTAPEPVVQPGRSWLLSRDGQVWTAVVTDGVVTECGEAEWIGRQWSDYRADLKARGCTGAPATGG